MDAIKYLLEWARSDSDDPWELSWTDRDRTRWRRGPETIDCFTFDDEYVATTTVETRDATWQLTPGPVSLATAFAAITTYRQHGITPQVDPDGRPFVAVDADGDPLQVFEERDADDDVRYVYLDQFMTLEEFPDFLEREADIERAFDKMSSPRGRAVAGN